MLNYVIFDTELITFITLIISILLLFRIIIFFADLDMTIKNNIIYSVLLQVLFPLICVKLFTQKIVFLISIIICIIDIVWCTIILIAYSGVPNYTILKLFNYIFPFTDKLFVQYIINIKKKDKRKLRDFVMNILNKNNNNFEIIKKINNIIYKIADYIITDIVITENIDLMDKCIYNNFITKKYLGTRLHNLLSRSLNKKEDDNLKYYNIVRIMNFMEYWSFNPKTNYLIEPLNKYIDDNIYNENSDVIKILTIFKKIIRQMSSKDTFRYRDIIMYLSLNKQYTKLYEFFDIIYLPCTTVCDIYYTKIFNEIILYPFEHTDRVLDSYDVCDNYITPVHNSFLNKYINRQKSLRGFYDKFGAIEDPTVIKYKELSQYTNDEFTMNAIYNCFLYYDNYYDNIKRIFKCNPEINYTNKETILSLLLIIKHSPYAKNNLNVTKILLQQYFIN